jgi:hypothetical protein
MDYTFEGYRTPLQRERRLRGWKQQYVVDQIKQLAYGDGYRKTFDGFEVNALSRLENGRIQRPRDPLPKLFAKLYSQPEEVLFPTPRSTWNGAVEVGNQALGAPSLDTAMEVFSRIWANLEVLASLGNMDAEMLRRQFLQFVVSAGSVATTAALQPFGRGRLGGSQFLPLLEHNVTAQAVTLVTGQYRRLEATTAAEDLLHPVRAHLSFISRLLDAEAHMGNVRLAASASEAAGFAAWLAFDRNDHAATRQHYQSAIGYAERAGSTLLQAYMLGSMSLWAAALDNGHEAIDLASKAGRLIPRHAPSAPQAWVNTVEAIAYASGHDAEASLAALGHAEEAIEHGRTDAEPLWPWVYPFDEAKIAVYRGACSAKLQLPKAGLPALHKALSALGPAPTKQRALALCDQAAMYALVDELEEACRLTDEAYDIGMHTRSRKIMHQVMGVRAQPAMQKPARVVYDLDERLRQTNQPSS